MEDTTLNNDPTEFVLFSDPFNISDSRYVGCKLINYYIDDYPFYHGNTYTTTANLVDKNFNIYVSAASHHNIISFIEPQVFSEDGSDILMSSCPLIKKEDKLVFANNGVMSFPEYNTELDPMGRDIRIFLYYWPTHPAFSYSTNLKKGALGNNCPALVSNPRQMPQTFFFDLDYIGRYGETKSENKTQTKIDMKVDGEDFYSGLGSFMIDLPEPLNGIVDAAITNEKVMVDEMIGSNKARLHYTAGAEDEYAPTTTMLHFRNNDREVTDRFANADEGILEFSAGDFNFMQTPMGYPAYNRIAPESVEVSYSPYGEDNWNELAVEEVPENYWPAMGWFYRGSLAGVTGQALKGWFDLKVKLTDAAGNWQEQVISPAFRIDDLAYSSVANVGKDNAHEVARYSLDGKRVDASHHGVTIIKMSDGTARKMIVQ